MLNDSPNHPLRILHILRAPVGGLFRHVADLAEQQARMGHQVGIVCDSNTTGAQTEEQIERLHPHCALGIRRIAMSRTLGTSDVSALAAIKAHVAQVSPQILHGHGAKGGAYARLLPRHKDRIAVYTLHGGSLHYNWAKPAGALYLGLERALRRRCHGLVFESRYAARAFVQKMGTPLCAARVVPNGLADGEFSALGQNGIEYDAVFVGELRKLKGVGTLIEAAALLAAERPFRIAIAGIGPDEKEFRQDVAAKKLGKNVDFLGYRPARSVFSLGRMVVVPSLAESFPYVILEAMASGCPVVATAVGGVPEMFGTYGDRLVPAGDAEALADAIRDTLDRPSFAQERAAALQARARGLFSVEQMARDITEFYSELRHRANDRPEGREAEIEGRKNPRRLGFP